MRGWPAHAGRPRPRWALLVLLAHGLLLTGLALVLQPARRPAAPAAAATGLTWLRLPAVTLPAARIAAAPLPAVAELRPRPRTPAATPPPLAGTGTPSLQGPEPATAAAAEPAALAPGPMPPASAPLNLALPPPAGRGRAGPAPTWHTNLRPDPAPEGRDARLAAALGTDTTLRTQRLSDGTVRIRRGAACTDVRPSRAEQLDPFQHSTHPLPRGVESCR